MQTDSPSQGLCYRLATVQHSVIFSSQLEEIFGKLSIKKPHRQLGTSSVTEMTPPPTPPPPQKKTSCHAASSSFKVEDPLPPPQSQSYKLENPYNSDS